AGGCGAGWGACGRGVGAMPVRARHARKPLPIGTPWWRRTEHDTRQLSRRHPGGVAGVGCIRRLRDSVLLAEAPRVMGAVSPAPSPRAPRRRVVAREQCPNYTRDTLDCGHVVTDYDNRRPVTRRCGWCEPAARDD